MRSRRTDFLLLAATAGCLCAALACTGDEGPSGPAGPAGPGGGGDPTPTDVERDEQAPEIAVAITAVAGASGPGGVFLPGDVPALTFTLEKEDGSAWDLAELSSGEALISGPTFNYQRVIPLRADVRDVATANADGSWTYVFPEPLPSSYAAPYHDTPSFGAGDGELTGQALLSGTYTVALSFAWAYEVANQPYLQVGEASQDFLLGTGAGALAPRAVTSQDNCNRCHLDLRAHAGRYRALALCLLCHTSGAEDLNDPAIEGGTPLASIESRVLFHRIHDGAHLPSVVGVGLTLAGKPDYGVAPEPYRLVKATGEVVDYSQVGFPAWPNRTQPTPVDKGFAALPPEAQAKQIQVHTGITSCYVCHGDPDGAGPIEAPAQGTLIEAQLTRRACGACHDDVDWAKTFDDGDTIMPPMENDVFCMDCHSSAFGPTPLTVVDGHRHPLRDPAFDAGVALELLAANEAGPIDGDGALDPGEALLVTFLLEDGAGAPIAPSSLTGLRAALSGPSENANLVALADVPLAGLTGAPPYTVPLPERVQLEHVGDGTSAPNDVFFTARAPHWQLGAGGAAVRVRTGTAGGASALASAASAGQNFVDLVDDGAAAGFARDDHVVVSDGVVGAEEYLRVQFVDGNRLWFSSPATPEYPSALRFDQPAGAGVAEVALELATAGAGYALDPASGGLLELAGIGDGQAVLIDYTAIWIAPSAYGPPLNDSPDLGEASGEWAGKDLAPGTYAVGLWGWRDHDFVQEYIEFIGGSFVTTTETTPYRVGSAPAALEIRGADAALLEPYALLSSSESCNACHQDLQFHGGGVKGFDTCRLCHGTAGAEDRPPYVAGNAPETSGTTVSFRTLLHRIHRGEELTGAGTGPVVGEGTAAWPDNFALASYDTIGFPAMPGATRNCAACHGAGNEAALFPADRDHPLQPGAPVLEWTAVCGACHDGFAAQAHIEAQTAPSGGESCEICHAQGEDEDVITVHVPR